MMLGTMLRALKSGSRVQMAGRKGSCGDPAVPLRKTETNIEKHRYQRGRRPRRRDFPPLPAPGASSRAAGGRDEPPELQSAFAFYSFSGLAGFCKGFWAQGTSHLCL